ncbi:hypothetical protein V6N12_042571 [Hibiscus sabdariffa]|uniref:Uncharacterized protein n=1 Tax=Hibiscus sabdariffa TaxID=183260 RepID=A0ABR2EF59_9ROSI
MCRITSVFNNTQSNNYLSTFPGGAKSFLLAARESLPTFSTFLGGAKSFLLAAREFLPTFSTFTSGAKSFGLQLVNPYQHVQHFLVEQRVSACSL